jgi:hypothetical protein
MFTVACIRPDGEFDHCEGFRTEREARAHINKWADGACEFRLTGPDREVIVETRFPVLMVA